MPKLLSLVNYSNRSLAIETLPDYPHALNGLQLENSGRVSKIGAAVDASLPVIEKAVEKKIDFLLVHHGLFWRGLQPVVHSFYQKIQLAIENDLAIYSAHIPLDVHPRFGNNFLLARAIGLKEITPFFLWEGIQLGVCTSTELARNVLIQKVEKAVSGPLHLCPAGGKKTKKIGILTGAAGSEIYQVAQEGVDTLITGEGPHWSYSAAEELQMNVLYAGHYATETFAVRAFAQHLAEKYRVPWEFIDHPTGL